MKKINNHRLVILLLVLLLVATIANILFVKALQYEINQDIQTIYKAPKPAPVKEVSDENVEDVAVEEDAGLVTE